MNEIKEPSVIAQICRYPVKGLSVEFLTETSLEPGDTIPWDRAFAIENGGQEFDPDNPRHLSKSKFLMLAKNEKLANLETRFDGDTGLLTILRGGKPVARGNLTERIGRQMLEQFFAAFMEDGLRGPPRIVGVEGHSFSDVPEKYLSIINLASVRDIERITGQSIDPVRFRGNLLVDGLEAWQEFELVGRDIRISDTVTLHGTARITRCAATNVNPDTARRDMTIPLALHDAFGHMDCGIYVEVIEGGQITEGDEIKLD